VSNSPQGGEVSRSPREGAKQPESRRLLRSHPSGLRREVSKSRPVSTAQTNRKSKIRPHFPPNPPEIHSWSVSQCCLNTPTRDLSVEDLLAIHAVR